MRERDIAACVLYAHLALHNTLLYPWELENGSVVDRAFVLMKDPLDT